MIQSNFGTECIQKLHECAGLLKGMMFNHHLVQTAPSGPVSLAISKANEALKVRVIGEPDTLFTLQFIDDLGGTNWQSVGSSSIGATGFHEMESVNATGAAGFYRAIQP